MTLKVTETTIFGALAGLAGYGCYQHSKNIKAITCSYEGGTATISLGLNNINMLRSALIGSAIANLGSVIGSSQQSSKVLDVFSDGAKKSYMFDAKTTNQLDTGLKCMSGIFTLAGVGMSYIDPAYGMSFGAIGVFLPIVHSIIADMTGAYDTCDVIEMCSNNANMVLHGHNAMA